jgi:hypothetical protein
MALFQSNVHTADGRACWSDARHGAALLCVLPEVFAPSRASRSFARKGAGQMAKKSGFLFSPLAGAVIVVL